MRHKKSGRNLAAAVSLVALIALSACGGESSPAAGEAPADDDGGTTSINLGYFPLVHTASAVHAAESGAFEAEGLEVELLPTAGGAQAIPSLMAGEYDITYGNYTSAILASEQGLPLKIIAGNDIGATDHGIMVNADSPLQEAADLEGKRVAVNNLKNIGTVAISAVLDEAGVDLSTVDFIELPFPDMQAALDRGDVDAIWQVEPFLASSLAAGDRLLFELFTGPVDDMPVAGWLTTAEFVEENPEAVSAFRRALSTSMEELQGNRELLVELVPTFTKVPAEVVQNVEMPEWEAEPDVEQLQKQSDLMAEYGIIEEPYDVSQIIVESS